MIASNEDAVKQYLVELTDHNLVTKTLHRGKLFVVMTPEYVQPILDADV